MLKAPTHLHKFGPSLQGSRLGASGVQTCFSEAKQASLPFLPANFQSQKLGESNERLTAKWTHEAEKGR